MSRTRVVIMITVTALVLGGIGYWLAQRIETYERERVEDIAEKVRRNPFLALERFLAKLGYSVETTRSTRALDEAPGRHDVILVEFSRELFTESRTKRLIDWIEDGGHLVLELGPYDEEEEDLPENALLERLQLRTPDRPADEAEEDHEGDDDEVMPAAKPSGNRRRVATVHAGSQGFKVAYWYGGRWLEDGTGKAETWRIDGMPAVLRYTLGNGQVTLIPSRNIWNNNQIGQNDHAAFLADLLGPPRAKVWVMYYLKVDNLLEIIWRHAAIAVIALSVTLALLLWSLYNRFGPLVVTESRRRRSLGEHVQAMANFAWRHGRAANLLDSTRAELRYRAEVRHPGFQYRTPDDQHAWLAGRIGVTPEAVRQAFEITTDRPEALLAAVSLLQKMRNSL